MEIISPLVVKATTEEEIEVVKKMYTKKNVKITTEGMSFEFPMSSIKMENFGTWEINDTLNDTLTGEN